MSEPLITELIDAPANAEKVRDQIAAVLSLELQNQYRLAKENAAEGAEDYNVKIFVDNSRPYDAATNERISIINITLQDITVPRSNPRIGNQKTQGVFDIYCIANGNRAADFYDDKDAAARAWKIMRLVWRIIMSEPYTYLGMRGTVTHRTFTKLEAGTPNEQSAQSIAVIRAPLEVHFAEGFFAGPTLEYEGYDFEVIPVTGQIVATPGVADQVTGVNNNPQEEGA